MDSPTNGWGLPNGKPDPRPHPLPHPYEIVQQSDMTLTLENGRAVVVATANAAKVNGGPPAGEPADPAKYELPAYRLKLASRLGAGRGRIDDGSLPWGAKI